MTAISVTPPYPTLSGADGTPIEAGYIYIGEYGLNPETNPVTVYWDSALSIPAEQPVRTIGGYFSRSGTPGKLYVSSETYSIIAKDKNSVVVWSDLYVSGDSLTNGSGITVISFNSVADMVSSSLATNTVAVVSGWSAKGDGGNSFFVVLTPAEYAITPNETSDFTLANGNIAVLQHAFTPAELIEKMQEGQNITFSCVGDSITWGSNGDNPGVQVATPYPSALQALLREYYSNTAITVINRGVSGDDTTNVLARISSIIGDSPDAVLLMIGTNDARTDRTITALDYANNLRSIVKQLSPIPVIFVSIPPEAGDGSVPNSRVVGAYRKVFSDVARELNCEYIDFYSLFKQVMYTGAYSRGDRQRDRLHFDEFGYQIMAECIFTAGLCNTDLLVKENQFIDNAYQSIVYDGATIVFSNTLHQANFRIDNNGSLIWYAFSEDPDLNSIVYSSALVTIGTATFKTTAENLALSGTSRQVITEQVSATTTFASNVPYPLTKMRPGLNRIHLTCGASEVFDIFGFAAIKNRILAKPEIPLIDESTYDDTFTASFANYLDSGITKLNPHAITLDSANEVIPIVKLIPKIGESTHLRIRAHFGYRSRLLFGQQSLTGTDYYQVYSLTFHNTGIFTHYYNIVKTQVQLAFDATVTTPAGGQHCIVDLIINNASTLFYVNGNLVFTMPVTLPIGWVMLWDQNNTGEFCHVEEIAILPNGTTAGVDLPGESWTDYQTNKKNFVDQTGSVVSSAAYT